MIRTQTYDVRSATPMKLMLTLVLALFCSLAVAVPARADDSLPIPGRDAWILATTDPGPDDVPSTRPTYEKGQPATVSDFVDLQSAISAQATPITLSDDFDDSNPTKMGVFYSLTLDLNGQDIDLGTKAYIYVSTEPTICPGPGNLTLEGSGSITSACGMATVIMGGYTAYVTVDGPTISCTDGTAVGMWYEDNSFTMTAGTLSGPNNEGLYVNGQSTKDTIDISGGTITGYAGIFISGMADATISGNAQVIGTNQGLSIRNGSLTMSGGTIATQAKDPTTYVPNSDGMAVMNVALAIDDDGPASAGGTGGEQVSVNITGGTISSPASGVDAIFATNRQNLVNGANTTGSTNTLKLTGGTVNGDIVNANVAPEKATTATPSVTIAGSTVKGDVITDPAAADSTSATYAEGGVTQVSAPTTVTGNVENVQGTTSVGVAGAAGPTINGTYSNTAKSGSGTATFFSGTVTQGFTEATSTQPGITVPSSVADDLVKATYTSGSSSSTTNAIGTSPLDLSDIPDNSKITVTEAPAKAVVDMPENSTITNSSPTNSITAQAPDGTTTTVDANGGSSPTPTPPAPAPQPPTARQLLQEAVDGAMETPGTVNEGAYTDVTWSAYAGALSNAQALLQNEAAPASQLNGARQALETAIADLVELTPALDQLQEAVASAAKGVGTNGSVYTTATWTAYQRALAAANVLLADPEGTDAQVEAATQALQSAVSGLVSEYVAIYRLYNPYSDMHLYSQSEAEVESLTAAGWRDEGIYWYAPAEGPGTFTILRLYNPYNGDHYYVPMTNLGETNRLLNMGWRLDSPASWFQSAPVGSQYPVYTLFNPYARVDTHLWTPYMNEVRTLERDGWEPNATVIWAAMLP